MFRLIFWLSFGLALSCSREEIPPALGTSGTASVTFSPGTPNFEHDRIELNLTNHGDGTTSKYELSPGTHAGIKIPYGEYTFDLVYSMSGTVVANTTSCSTPKNRFPINTPAVSIAPRVCVVANASEGADSDVTITPEFQQASVLKEECSGTFQTLRVEPTIFKATTGQAVDLAINQTCSMPQGNYQVVVEDQNRNGHIKVCLKAEDRARLGCPFAHGYVFNAHIK